MTDYTDVFGGSAVPPASSSFNAHDLSANAVFQWPYNYSGSDSVVAKINEVTTTAGLTLTMPGADEVSPGEDCLFRNVGSNAFTIKDAGAVDIVTVDPGETVYIYVSDNTTPAGDWGVFVYGVGSSSVDAATLAGRGILAIGTSLNSEHEYYGVGSGMNVTSSYRARVINFTGGAESFTFDPASTLTDGFFCMIRNSGTGTLTLDPNGSEQIDGQSSMLLQPGESAIVACSGSALYTIGYGRSTQYQFTQLTKDVSAGGSFTLSSAEATNKLLTFVGNPVSDVTVVVPDIVSVYYTFNDLSTPYSVTVKTSAGTGPSIPQTQRAILFCDGSNVYSAQSALVTSAISLVDGSITNPALNFASKTNTGLYKSGSQDLGVAVNGTNVGIFTATGLNDSPIGQTTPAAADFTTVDVSSHLTVLGNTRVSTVGPDADSQHILLNVASDTVTLNTATQTLTNKTLSVDNNTVSGIAASSFVLSNASGNIDGAAAQKTIPSGVVVGTTDTQTLTNKTLTDPGFTLNNAKTTPVDADEVVIRDSAATFSIKKLTWANLTAAIKTYYDSVTATLTNKTISVDNNTVSGIAASSFVLSNASGDIDGAAAQKAIPAGVVVGTTDTQTLTNKTYSGGTNSGTQSGNHTLSGQVTFSNATAPIITAKIGPSSTQQHTLPVVTSDTVTLNDAAQTLTNKTLTSPAIYGGHADLTGGLLTIPTAAASVVQGRTTFAGNVLSIGTGTVVKTMADTDTAQTLTNKTLSVDNNTVSGIAASSFVLSNASGNIDGAAAQKVIPSGAVVGTTDAQTLTNKTLTSPNINWGTIDGATIGGESAAAGTFTTLTVIGQTTLGDQVTDPIYFVGKVDSTLLPMTTNSYTLGNSTLRWSTVYGVNADFSGTTTITTAAISGGNIDNTVVGGTTRAAGNFTTIDATNLDDTRANLYVPAEFELGNLAYIDKEGVPDLYVGKLNIAKDAVTAPAASDGNVFSGVYSPTLTNVTNVAASAAYNCQYMRVGNIVTVSGCVDIDPTTGGAAIELGMSLPVASNFSSTARAGGTWFGQNGQGGSIRADSTNYRAAFEGIPTDAANRTYWFTFTYRIQ